MPTDTCGPEVGSADVELAVALEQHLPLLLASARALMRNESDARDLVQTTCEIAARRYCDLRDRTAARSWLLTIQVHEAFRLRRRLNRAIHFGVVDPAILTGPGPSADALALRIALAKLPPRARTAIVLHYLADLPVGEVARVMRISDSTTKGHLKAGLARLREELGDD